MADRPEWQKVADRLRSNEKLVPDDIALLATKLVAGLVDGLQKEWLGRTDLSEKDQTHASRYALPICWGLVALDPHHAPFVRLLNSIMALALPEYAGHTTALLDEYRKLSEIDNEINEAAPLSRAERLVDLALDHRREFSACPGVFLIEGCHLILGTPSDRYDSWLEDLLLRQETADAQWPWPKGGLSLPHLRALSRASAALGNAFPGRDLGCLVAKTVVSLCWSPEPPLNDEWWRKECVDLLLVRFGGSDPDDNDRQSVFERIPEQIRLDFCKGEEEALGTDDDWDDELEDEAEEDPEDVPKDEGMGAMEDDAPELDTVKDEAEEEAKDVPKDAPADEEKERSDIRMLFFMLIRLAREARIRTLQVFAQQILACMRTAEDLGRTADRLSNLPPDRRQTVRQWVTYAILQSATTPRLRREGFVLAELLLRDDPHSGTAAAFRTALALCDWVDEMPSRIREPDPELLVNELALKDWGAGEQVGSWLRLLNVLHLRSLSPASLGVPLPPLLDHKRIVQELQALIKECPQPAPMLRGHKELTVIRWKSPTAYPVRFRLEPRPPSSTSTSSAWLRSVRLPLRQTFVKHATTNESLLEMIHRAGADRKIEFEARESNRQYTGVKLAWFALDATSVPAMKSYLDNPDHKEDPAQRSLINNRYGCVVLRFPLTALLDTNSSLSQLGERVFPTGQVISQSVLLDATSVAAAIVEAHEWELTLLKTLACDEDALIWPYDIHYSPFYWTNPEFAVRDGLLVHPGQGLQIAFEAHGGDLCIRRMHHLECDDCFRGAKRTPAEARDAFIETIREAGLSAAQDVERFIHAWPKAFDDADRHAIEAALAPMLRST